jgi:alpha-ketoglutarate-dependent taurine dioxygenase
MRATGTIPLRRLKPVGAEVPGLSLLDADEPTIAEVRGAVSEYGLLVFHGQDLTPEGLCEVTKRFGVPEEFSHERAYPERPEVCIVTSYPRQAKAQPVYWHSDGAQQPEPPTLSLFYAVKTPGDGGETLFTDARDAYDALPDELRDRIETRKAVMRNGFEQPLVRIHAETGRHAVYADFGQTVALQGLERDEARDVFAALRAHVARPEATYAVDWKPGDLAMWDNAAVLHSATRPPATGGKRLMWRTTVRGVPAVAA